MITTMKLLGSSYCAPEGSEAMDRLCVPDPK
jgi:hypothetical protein